MLQSEPAALISLIATILVGVLQQVVGSGLVNDRGVDVLNVLITLIPIVAGLVIRQLVTPATDTPANAAPPAQPPAAGS